MTLFGFGKKKEKEINAPVCTCNGNCSVSETVEPENLNNVIIENNAESS